ncbi:unnamed protein product [Linum trigynum]|uniref:Retrotransposon Copia-like N-terminal domain-containing protein n=1 Tax=Linum trigynum TaxID=586398 RepID=A0AAV2DUF6_9ROSI
MTNESSTSATSAASDPLSSHVLSEGNPAPPHIDVKLTPTNYLLWKLQLLPLLNSFNLSPFIDGSSPDPPRHLAIGVPNPVYAAWYKRDQLVLSWIVSSLTDVVLSKLVGFNSAFDAWTRLATAYGAANHHGIRNLKDQFDTLKCGSESIDKYLARAKDISDRLAALDHPVSDDDLVSRCLKGLGESCLSFIPVIEARPEPISFDDFHSLLLNEEARLHHHHLLSDGHSPSANFSRLG